MSIPIQTNDPSAHAFLNEGCLVLRNKQVHQDQKMLDHISTQCSYVIPNDDHLTFVLDKNVFAVRRRYNIFSIFPVSYNLDLHTETTIDAITSTVSKMVLHTSSMNWLLNLMDCKVLFYFPDDKKVPLGYIKMDLHEQDVFHTKFPCKLRLYVRHFQYDDNRVLKLLPGSSESLYRLLLQPPQIIVNTCCAHTSKAPQPQPFQTQPSPQPQSQPFQTPQPSPQPTIVTPIVQPAVFSPQPPFNLQPEKQASQPGPIWTCPSDKPQFFNTVFDKNTLFPQK